MVKYCARGKYLVIKCLNGCWKYIPQRCPVSEMCFNCSIQRRSVILARLYSKYSETSKSIQGIVLWTLGTDLKNTSEGRKLLSNHWKYFRARMNKLADWNPLFRVVETGSKGRYLHIHYLNNGFMKHADVLRAWREVTGKSTNVNFSRKNMDPKIAIRYAGKYMTKDASKFSFLGLWYGRKESTYIPEPCIHGDYLNFYNTIVDSEGHIGQMSIIDGKPFNPNTVV